jgi:hypothetical protein
VSRKVQLVAAALCALSVIAWCAPGIFFGLDRDLLLPAAIVFGLIVVGLFLAGERFGLDRVTFLCDSCKYGSERDCRRPERPNATRCPDYRRQPSS